MQIDFPSHILPAADHGSDGLETSLKQVSLAAEFGMDLMIATSHFYPRYDSAAEFLRRRKACSEELFQALAGGERRAPKILLGAEVQLCRNLDNMPELDQLCVQGTNVLLLELPVNFSMHRHEQTVESLIYGRKMQVVLAHIDRYDTNTIDLLLDMGCLAQLNVSSLCHLRTRRRSLQWASGDCVVALGSDIHGTATGYKEFAQAKKRLKGDYDAIMARTKTLLGL